MQVFGFFNIIWPNELPLRVIIVIIWLIAISVVGRGIHIRNKGNKNLALLEKLSDVGELVHGIKNIDWNESDYSACFKSYKQHVFDSIFSDEETQECETEDEQESDSQSTDDDEENQSKDENEESFDWNVEKESLENDTIDLWGHLKTIYDAGCKRNHLEPQLLIQNTVAKVFAGAESLHTMISLFLVCGILGTLFGLAICIASFNMSSVGGEAVFAGISDLFRNLKGAFAPSIWGVFFTILFVWGYTVFVQEKCIDDFEDRLTNLTIKVWMPKLFPTDFQRGEFAIARLKDQVENAEDINKGATALVKNLKEANGIIEVLSNLAREMNQGLNMFKDDRLKLSEINDALVSMKDGVETTRKSAELFINAKNEFVKDVAEPLVLQSKEATTTMQNVGTKIDKINHPLETASDAIQKTVQDLFRGISNDMEEQNKNTNEKIADTFDNIVKKVDTLIEHQAGVNNAPVEKQLNDVNENLKRMSRLLENSGRGNGGTHSNGMGLFGKIMLACVVVCLIAGLVIQGLTLVKLNDMQVNMVKPQNIVDQYNGK